MQVVDFGRFSDVVALAERLKDDPLDIVVANAAVAKYEYNQTTDGWEETYATRVGLTACSYYMFQHADKSFVNGSAFFPIASQSATRRRAAQLSLAPCDCQQ